MWAGVVQVFTWAMAGEASGSLSVVNKFNFSAIIAMFNYIYVMRLLWNITAMPGISSGDYTEIEVNLESEVSVHLEALWNYVSSY